jgi:hypothetical protein
LYDNHTVIATRHDREVQRDGPVLVCPTAKSVQPMRPEAGEIRPAGKSGGAALHIAWSLGCNPIAIIGLDGYNYVGPKHAYHEEHGATAALPRIDQTQRQMQQLFITAANAKKRQVYDLAGPTSGLHAFPPMSPDVYLEEICTQQPSLSPSA